jgi:hypothetical protein
VGIFGIRRCPAAPEPRTRAGLSEATRLALPPRFGAVGEALVSGSGSVEACEVVGSDLARDGVPLEEVLDALSTTYRMVRGGDPDHADTRALALGWSEATLGYLNRLSCEDPLTGLASMAHVRSRLGELYRGQPGDGGAVRDTYALVVVDVPSARGTAQVGRIRVEQALRASRIGELVRSVFTGAQTIARVGPRKVVVLCERDDRLGGRVAELRQRLVGLGSPVPSARVWLQALPDSEAEAATLLDELARARVF